MIIKVWTILLINDHKSYHFLNNAMNDSITVNKIKILNR